MCKVLNVSRSSYYAYVNGQTHRIKSNKQLLLNEVKDIFENHKRRYGSRRIREELKDKGFEIGLYRVRRMMAEQGLEAIQPRRFVPRTTQSHPSLQRSPNLLLEAPFPQAPNKVIVGDITYLPTSANWLYLSVWMDLFSRKIVGWRVDDHLKASLVILALQQVIRNRQPSPGLIVHSDGGGQYGSVAFRNLLNRHKFCQSMTRKDNHYDNAFAESLFSRFKAELLTGKVFENLQEARLKSFEYIEGYYNTIRKHSSLGYRSPDQFENLYWRSSASRLKDRTDAKRFFFLQTAFFKKGCLEEKK